MSNLIKTIIESITSAPGILFYNLILSFSFAASLQGSLVHRNGTHRQQANRQVSGLFVLLLFQLVLFTVSGLDWQGMLNLTPFLPVIDRAMVAFSLVWIIWLWAFPDTTRWADVLALMLAILVIIAGLFSISYWNFPANQVTFNNSWLDQTWCTYSLILSLIGITILLIRHPVRWGIGLVLLILVGASLIAHLLIPTPGDYIALVRLGQMLTYPLLIGLPQRLEMLGEAKPKLSTVIEKENRRYTVDAKTIRSFFDLSLSEDPQKIRSAMLHTISQTMLADIILLVTPPTVDGQLNISEGYDLIRDEVLPARELPKNVLPLIANALLKGRGVRLQASHTASPDMHTLAEILGLSTPGNLLAVPLTEPGHEPIGGILLLSTYSNRTWNIDDQAYLTGIAVKIAAIYRRNTQIATDRLQKEQALLDLQTVRKQLDEVSNQIPEESNADISALIAMQKENQVEIDRLVLENEQLRKSNQEYIAPQKGSIAAQVEDELRLSLSEVAHLQNALADANMRILAMERKTTGLVNQPYLDEKFKTITQELTSEVASIYNQIDGLMDTTQTILPRQGDRLKVIVNRVRTIVGALNKIILVNELPYSISSTELDPTKDIEQIIMDSEASSKSKDITFQKELPDQYPKIKADQQGFKDMINNLLENAISATPTGGTVNLSINTKEDNKGQRIFHIQVKDDGGSISKTDLECLFTGMNSTAHKAYPGLGSPQAFSTALALAEVMSARMWVDTIEGKSSIINIVFPVSENDEISMKQTT